MQELHERLHLLVCIIQLVEHLVAFDSQDIINVDFAYSLRIVQDVDHLPIQFFGHPLDDIVDICFCQRFQALHRPNGVESKQRLDQQHLRGRNLALLHAREDLRALGLGAVH